MRWIKTLRVCAQHSYMRVPGITMSSMKWQVRNQSSGWMSASALIRPSPYRPPSGSRWIIRSISFIRSLRPPGSLSDSASSTLSKRGPKHAFRFPALSAFTASSSYFWTDTATSSFHLDALFPFTGLVSSSLRIIPPEFSTSSSVKKPAHPSDIVIRWEEPIKPLKLKKKRNVSPWRTNFSILISYLIVSPGCGRPRWNVTSASSNLYVLLPFTTRSIPK